MQFTLLQKDEKSAARAGLLSTDHGNIETPIFMPVGTLGSVKALHFKDLEKEVNAQIILGNTYHLFLRPGIEVLEKAGGLHKFNSWEKPILTDSGGYQVYSLAASRKISNEGVVFQSHIDGSRHHFTPENVIDTQRKIGADIIMAFDECTPYPCEFEYAKSSMELTHKWLERCFEHYKNTKCSYGYEQALFPIVQGSVYMDLRKKAAEKVASYGAIGNAIGGLSVGEPHDIMYEITELVCNILPADKARYLMGVGTPANILECISLGVDMFDCVIPTRNGRNGMLYTSEGIINIKNKKWQKDYSIIDSNSQISVSQRHSKAFLRHLFVSKEILGPMIASLHNLGFYMWLTKQARKHIQNGDFSEWKQQIVPRLQNRL